jgi:hypothetical protein
LGFNALQKPFREEPAFAEALGLRSNKSGGIQQAGLWNHCD